MKIEKKSQSYLKYIHQGMDYRTAYKQAQKDGARFIEQERKKSSQYIDALNAQPATVRKQLIKDFNSFMFENCFENDTQDLDLANGHDNDCKKNIEAYINWFDQENFRDISQRNINKKIKLATLIELIPELAAHQNEDVI